MKETEELYNKIGTLKYREIESLFDSQEFYKKNSFDWSLLLYKNQNKKTQKEQKKQDLKNVSEVVIDMFSPKNFNAVSNENVNKKIDQLQKLFYFYIKNLAKQLKNNSVLAECEKSENEGNWNTPAKQAELLNMLLVIDGIQFRNNAPFSEKLLNFSDYKNGALDSIESVLKLLYNFNNNIKKEDVIAEINFIREQQKNILPCKPDTKRSKTEGDAKNEIASFNKNVKELRKIDFGFNIKNYTQTILPDSNISKMILTRKITCKYFKETDDLFKELKFNDKTRKIDYEKDERISNKNALQNKYLYSERNVFTHSGYCYSIYGLFHLNHNKKEIKEYSSLLLQSLFDAREFLKRKQDQKISDALLNMLNFYFQKIVSKIIFSKNLNNKNINSIWNEVFDENGNTKLVAEQLEKSYIYELLNDREIQKLEELMTFLYCSSHEDVDFIEYYKFPIILYSTYLTLRLNLCKLQNK